MKTVCTLLLGAAITCMVTVASAITASTSFQGSVNLALESDEDQRALEPTVVWIEGPTEHGGDMKKVTIAQKNSTFEPNFVVAVVGQEVAMPNLDSVAHNAYSSSTGNEFDVGIYPKGTSKTISFKNPGIVDVRCRMHKRMYCTIVVVPNKHFQLIKTKEAQKDRAFELKDLPDGLHTLRAWQQGFESHESKVEIKEGTAAPVAITLKPKDTAPPANQE